MGMAPQPAALAALGIYTSPWQRRGWQGDSSRYKLEFKVICHCCLVRSLADGVDF